MWLAKDLVRWLGAEEAKKFCHNSHLPPPVTVFANTYKLSRDLLLDRLQAEGVNSIPIGDDFLILRHTGDIAKLPAFQEGLFFVMDPGAIWAVRAMNPKPDQVVIDLCAAPGGKSFSAACFMENSGQVYAFDIHQHRVGLIQESALRLGLNCITAEVKDATNYTHSLQSIADTVIIDAPCSGFGTIRKRPEIKYNRSATDISQLVKTQREMLTTGAKYVKPNGTLVYSTCTVAREENIDNIRWFLQRNPQFKLLRPTLPQAEDIRYILEDDCLQILPGPCNDGFFIATIVQQAS